MLSARERDELLDLEYDEDSSLNLSISKVIFLILSMIFLGFYVGNLLFGVNSFKVLNTLEAKEQSLRVEIEKLKEYNAKLQKEYFELKGLEP